jgi:protein TonB
LETTGKPGTHVMAPYYSAYLDTTGGSPRRNWKALAVAALLLAAGTLAAIKIASTGGAGTRKADQVIAVVIPPEPKEKPHDIPRPKDLPESIPAEQEAPKEEQEEADAGPGLPPGGTDPSWGSAAGNRGSGKSSVRKASLVSTWMPYARQAADRIAGAMRTHATLKTAAMVIQIKIWIDSTGRVARAVVQPTGNPLIDSALQNDVLIGMQLSQPPPAGMVMPVSMKVTARRPG